MKSGLRARIMIIFFPLALLTGYYALTYTTGPPSGNTAAPGDGNCTSCHSGTLVTSGTNYNNISLQNNIPSTGYVPDSIYSFTLAHTQSGISKFGFQLTVLRALNNAKAGTLLVTNTSTTQLLAGTRDYIQHKSAGTSGSGGISWSFNWKAPSTNVGNVNFYAIINASDNLNNSSGDMIIAKTFSFNVSSLLPVASISVLDDSVCVDDTVFLSGNGTNTPTSWAWQIPGGTPATSTLQNPAVVYKTSGIYTVTLTAYNGKGASLPETRKIYVAAKPTVTTNPVGTVAICQGDSVKLEAVAGKSLSYLWSTSQTTPFIYVKNAGSYFVTVTNITTGCSQTSKAVNVVVNSLPTVNLTSDLSLICEGDPVTFTADPATYKAYSFKSGSTILQNSILSTFVTSALTDSQSVFVIVTDQNNCMAQSNEVITRVNNRLDTPQVWCGTSTTSSVEFIWQQDPNATGYEISIGNDTTWVTPSGGSSANSHSINGLGYSETVELFLRAKDNLPCIYSYVAKISCATLPCSGITYSIVYDSVICNGDSTKIEIHDLNTTKYAINFDNRGWSNDTIYLVKPSVNSSYHILLTDSNKLNCPPIDLNAAIRVSLLPVVSLVTDKPGNEICKGNQITFSATSGYEKYIFVKNNSSVLQDSNLSEYTTSLLNDSDLMIVTAVNTDGCSANSNEIPVKVHSLPVANYTYTLEFLKFSFTDHTTNAVKWLWDFGDSQTDTVMNPVHTYALPGSYIVSLHVTDLNGCEDDADKTTVNAYKNNVPENKISLLTLRYLPAEKSIELNCTLKQPGNLQVNILNSTGSVVKPFQKNFRENGRKNILIPVSELRQGIYVVNVIFEGAMVSKKLIID